MKLKALVVAAMAIISVNAGGFDKLPSGVENNGGRSKSVVPEGLMSGSSESESPQDPPMHGSESVSPPKSLGHESKPVFPQGPLGNEPDEPQDPDPTKKVDPICSSINAELHTLWNKFNDLNHEFREQMSGVYGLMMMKESAKGMNERSKRGNLKAKKIQAWLEFHPEAIPKLREIKAKYTNLEKDCDEIWARLNKNKCPKTLERLSLEEMAQMGYVPQWYNENYADILDKQ
ncbi:hypothetical protein BASA50_008433 [Batrachochytrium salamandrivorans]|uniref:SXP/RAL-2 family protein Ani s 5-like cation-binding domain-containing protein n=1 Tax=Batrachochytrium salamandrivorans TaxID=1357716 RepID=A0ABQ8EXH8_9FUNG|nr:hypothetical protein BASA62_003660 [Batrachochytrium salamandrivorans]KAH6588367.1 hypothetical protein BASA50_010775 [Batrachochytrium salamandrivorans]KAH6589442.1 hypothetical protein BASA61_005615 [Batrachochytrium salamandrivorans]KAH6591919.1 hypothetical protein BASA50_008433 [Batrachochytrium salamandrivorans]KAH9264653.1 hypothetical protein BASA83_011827 [Batrachochytrium salamandrivorans]